MAASGRPTSSGTTVTVRAFTVTAAGNALNGLQSAPGRVSGTWTPTADGALELVAPGVGRIAVHGGQKSRQVIAAQHGLELEAVIECARTRVAPGTQQ